MDVGQKLHLAFLLNLKTMDICGFSSWLTHNVHAQACCEVKLNCRTTCAPVRQYIFYFERFDQKLPLITQTSLVLHVRKIHLGVALLLYFYFSITVNLLFSNQGQHQLERFTVGIVLKPSGYDRTSCCGSVETVEPRSVWINCGKVVLNLTSPGRKYCQDDADWAL